MLGVFAITIFLGAALLFFVQPMVAKMLLPQLGGSPAVWNTCMVFFQAALLAGYAYAHWSVRLLGPRRQAMVHGVLVLTPLAVLPVVLRGGEPPTEGSPVVWLLLALAGTIGLPFAVAATGGPLLQRWFAATGHRAAKDPYFLYAASNAGSLIALLGYPLLVEPLSTVGQQRWMWSGGYVFFALLTIACGFVVIRTSRSTSSQSLPVQAPIAAGGNPSARQTADPETMGGLWRQRLYWVLLAFIPSSLMLGVTQYMSTDIAAVPLLWVVPLSIYLLTFIMAFSGRAGLSVSGLSRILPILAVGLAIAILVNATQPIWVLLLLHLLTFFMGALLCHLRLALSRPHPSRLTEFFLLVAIGGVLGGIFNALVAPIIFTSVAEYPIAIVLALLMRIQTDAWWQGRPVLVRRLADFGAPLLVAALLVLGYSYSGWLKAATSQFDTGDFDLARLLAFGFPALVAYLFVGRRLGLALSTGALYGAGLYFASASGGVIHNERTFYGIHRVKNDGTFVALVHSTTEHGIQAIEPAARRIPLGYYHPQSPIGQVFYRFHTSPLFDRIGIVGLGAGSLAGYGQSGQHITFYEIDPAIERIAQEHFSYLGDSPATWEIRLGDGRKSLEKRAADGGYGLLVIDAFSSDAIPVHLMTREAVELYMQKLAPDGILAFHISNRYLSLWPVLERIAAELGLASLRQADGVGDLTVGFWPSQWVLIARDPDAFGPLAGDGRWTAGQAGATGPLWTDDYSNIVSIFRWGDDD